MIDLRNILKSALIYNTYQYIVGGVRARRLFITKDTKIAEGMKVLDIGCGPGYLIDFLPEVDYTGIDIDQHYIETAKNSYKYKQFYCKSVDDFKLEAPHTFDVVISAGVVHHLTDQQSSKLFELAKKALKPNGRLITLDGCYTDKQNIISKKLLDLDRGEFIRTENEYKSLANKHFTEINTKIDNSYFHIPYTSIIMECKNN